MSPLKWILALFLSAAVFAEDWQKVYLATYPRSGNHWLRYIIEEATGIVTSSVYKDPDPPHLPYVFSWRGYAPDHGYEGNRRYPNKNDIVVIKTHYPVFGPTAIDIEAHQKVIRIVRHPIDSIYSYYSYIEQEEGRVAGQMPDTFVQTCIDSWKKFQEYYNTQPNVYTYLYEDMLKNPYTLFKEILEEIGYTPTHEDLCRAIQKYPPFGTPLKHISKFSSESLQLIFTELASLLEQFGYVASL